MATTKEYLNYVLEQLNDLDQITYRMMMGDYIIYYKTKIIAYICDDRLLVKPVEAAKKLLKDAPLEPPYKGAKDMILVQEIEDKDFMCKLFNEMFDELPYPKPKKPKKDK